MSKFENPMQFDIKKKSDGIEIVYSNLMEICQGGPEIGTISINGNPIQNYRFGGPCLHQEDYIYAPAYVRKFLGTGFKLSKINCQTLNVELLGKTKDLIFLDKIVDNRIYFFEDIDKMLLRYYEL